MIKKALFFFVSLVSVSLLAQIPKTTQILKEIEQNNSELKAFKNYEESQKFVLKSTNALPSLEVGAYFLPFGNSVAKNYTELEVKQSFEFPMVYVSRNKLITKQQEQINIKYQQKRQAILLEGLQLTLKIITANKQEKVEKHRLEKAQKLYTENQKLFDIGEMNILEFNKSKVAFVKAQFKLKNVQSEKENSLISLANLNGGKPILVTLSEFEDDFLLPNKQTLWQERLSQNKTLQAQQKAEEIAKEKIKLAKHENLPNLAVGYSYQGFKNDIVHGVFVGMNIPLWGNKSRRKAAEKQFNFEKINTTVKHLIIQSEFDKQYNNYQNLLNKYNEFKETLKILNSEELLFKAYRTGEISFSEYFVEIEFYHNANDAMLAMEKELHLLKSQLLNHKL